MKFLRLAAWAMWFTLAGVAFAHAAPLVGLFGVIGQAIAGLGVVGQLLVGLAIKVGLGLLQKALQKKPQEPGIQAEITVGGDNPLSFIMGHFATAGQLEYVNTWGKAGKTPNAYITHVISLSDLPLNALTGLWVNDQKVTLPDMSGSAPTDQGWPIEEFEQDGTDYLWIKFYDGSQTTADSFLTSTFGSDPERPWGSNQIGRGVAYAIVTARRNDELFSGIPSYLFETDGIPLYDIRKDDTAGGDGDHRWDDPDTWEPSDNPVVHIYNIIRGIRYDDEWVYGGQTISAYQLPDANWIAAANACDEEIENADESTEPRYRSGCQVTADQPPADVIESILRGCSGHCNEVGGAFKIVVGAPGAAVYTFTDETIIVTEAQGFDPFPGLESTYNGAQASYPEPAEKWAAKDAPAYLRSDLESLDDGRRLVTGLAFPTVPYALQVQRLLKEAVEDARRFRQHQHYLPPDAQVLEPGDVVAWTSARNSYSDKKFLVVEVADQPNLLVLVTLKEIDPSDYSWDALVDEKPYSIGFIGPIRPPVQEFAGWAVEPYTFVDASGNPRRPGILVKADGDLDDVEFVRIQVRLDGETTLEYDQVYPYGDPRTNSDPLLIPVDFSGILPDTDYEVRGLLEPYSDRPTNWSSWLKVTTPNVKLGSGDFYPFNLAALDDDVKELMAWTAAGMRDALEELRAIAVWTVNQDLSNFTDKQQLRTELRSESDSLYGTVTAEYSNAITAATGPGSALVLRIESLEATIPTLATASAVSTLASRVDATELGVAANAGSIVSLNTALDGKADSSTVSTLASTVSTQGGTLTSQGLAITALENTVNDPSTGLASKAAASTVSALSSTVASQGGTLTSHGSAITALQNTINDPSTGLATKASSSAVSSLSSTVSSLSGTVSSQASAITALQSSVGEVSGSATFRMATGLTPSAGWTSRAAIQVRVDSGSTFRNAGIYLEATASAARVIIAADQFIVTDGTNNAQPFVFTGGTAYMQNARIGTVYFDQLSSSNGKLILRGNGSNADIRMFT